MEGWGGSHDYTPDFEPEQTAPSFQPVHRLEGWIAPADLYAAINELAEMNPEAKHVCWDMLMLAHKLPRTHPDSDRSLEGGDGTAPFTTARAEGIGITQSPHSAE